MTDLGDALVGRGEGLPRTVRDTRLGGREPRLGAISPLTSLSLFHALPLTVDPAHEPAKTEKGGRR